MLDHLPFPEKPTLFWSLVSATGILYPLMTMHFHVMYGHLKVGWFSWWLFVCALFGILLLALGGYIGEEQSGYTQKIATTFYISTVVGGSLGAFIVFVLVRRFLPRLLDFRRPKETAEKRKLGIKTLFWWLTAAAIGGSIWLNAEKIHVEFFPSSDPPLFFAMLLGVFWGAVIGLLVWVPLVKWFQHFRPYWISLCCLALLSALAFVAVIGVITAFTYHIEQGLYWVVRCNAAQLIFIVLAIGCWVYGCRKAGLLPAHKILSKEEKQKRGLFRKSLSGVNWLSQRAMWLLAIASFLYATGWCVVHFVMGGEERDVVSVMKGTLAESDNWLDDANEKWAEGTSPDQNVIVKIIQLINPLPNESYAEDYYEKLGLNEEQILEIEKVNLNGWIQEREFDYQEALRKRFDLGDDFVAEPFEEFGQPLPGQSLAPTLPEGISEKEYELIQKLSWEYEPRLFRAAPWNRKMCSLAADFVEEHQPILTELREISKQQRFYSPWIRGDNHFHAPILDAGRVVLGEAIYLLQMSAMYHLGNGRIDEAIQDCEAISRLTRREFTDRLPTSLFHGRPESLRTYVADTAVQIAFHKEATADQLKKLLEILDSQGSIEPEGFDKEFRDAAIRRLGLEAATIPESGRSDENVREYNPFQHWYQSNLSTIDWESWKSVFDETVSKKQELLAALRTGEMKYRECSEQYQELSTIRYPNFGKEHYYEILGQRLWTFVRGPKYKGEVLGTVTSCKMLDLPYGYHLRTTQQKLNSIVIAIQYWKITRGSLPDNIEQLVPEVLSELPQDFLGGRDFIYRKDGSSFQLYSVGVDEEDDGGLEMTRDRIFERPSENLVEHYFDYKERY